MAGFMAEIFFCFPKRICAMACSIFVFSRKQTGAPCFAPELDRSPKEFLALVMHKNFKRAKSSSQRIVGHFCSLMAKMQANCPRVFQSAQKFCAFWCRERD